MEYRKLNDDVKARKLAQTRALKNQLFTFFNKSPLKNYQKKKIFILLKIKKQPFCKYSPKNICLESGWEKNIISKFKVSRHILKKNAARLKYPGLRKASW